MEINLLSRKELDPKPTRFGDWKLNPKRMTLTLTWTQDRPRTYTIELQECKTSAELLDWIFQISRKPWISGKQLADMLRALQVILDPQATLCSCGIEHGPKDIKKLIQSRKWKI